MATNHLQPQESQELSSGAQGLLILLLPPVPCAPRLCSSAHSHLRASALVLWTSHTFNALSLLPFPASAILSVRSVMRSLSASPSLTCSLLLLFYSPWDPIPGMWDSLPVSPSKMPTQVLPAAVPSGMRTETGINLSVGAQSTASLFSHFTGRVQRGQGTSLRPWGSVDRDRQGDLWEQLGGTSLTSLSVSLGQGDSLD